MALVPDNAIKYEGAYVSGERVPAVTMDGTECWCQFVAVYDNVDGRYDEELNALCMKKFGIPFSRIRSGFYERLEQVSSLWHYIKLNKD